MPAAGQDTPNALIASAASLAAFAPRSAVVECPHFLQNRTPIATQKIAPAGLIFFQNDITWRIADPNFGNSFAASNKDYLLLWNTGAATVDVTVRSFPEPTFGRLGDYVASLAPSTISVVGPITKLGWMFPDGNIYVDAPTRTVMLAVVTVA